MRETKKSLSLAVEKNKKKSVVGYYENWVAAVLKNVGTAPG